MLAVVVMLSVQVVLKLMVTVIIALTEHNGGHNIEHGGEYLHFHDGLHVGMRTERGW